MFFRTFYSRCVPRGQEIRRPKMPLLGGQVACLDVWCRPLRMPASFRAREARVMPAAARCPQGECGRQREQQFYSYSYYLTFDDTITISQGVRYARSPGCTRQHQHILILLSRPDSLHTLPLTTILRLCRVVRWWIATTNLLEQIFHHRAHRAHRGAARGDREGSSYRRCLREPSICSCSG